MDTKMIANLIDVSLCLVALFISVRSFDVYTQFRYVRLFILGLSMALLSLSAAANFTANYVKVVTLHTGWFSYIAQISGFLFIFLSLTSSSARVLKSLMFLSALTVLPLLLLLFLSPALPALPQGGIQIFLEVDRWLLCFMIFFAYYFALLSKATHFNRFMTGAFLFISLGNFLALMQGFAPTFHANFLSDLGSIITIIGLVALIVAVSWN